MELLASFARSFKKILFSDRWPDLSYATGWKSVVTSLSRFDFKSNGN